MSQAAQVYSFHGGIHPAENKQQSLQRPLQQAPLPQRVVLPLSQHIGAEAKPCVQVGDYVRTGQIIAEPVGFVSAPVHASISGQVSAIEPRPVAHPSGLEALCIEIQGDGADQWVELTPIADYRSLSAVELLKRIRQAGIAGLGGAGFPSSVKLQGNPQHPIDTLILNGAECEPYITADHTLMREHADQVIAGAEILRHIIQPQRCIIATEDNKADAYAALCRAAADSGIEVIELPTKYPSGGEKQLIQLLTNRQVPSGGIPAHVGVVCQNVATAVAIYQAITLGQPLVSRIVTLTGAACGQPGNWQARLGTLIDDLLPLAQFQPQQAAHLIMGGPMMGFTLQSSQLPLVKTSNCILAPSHAECPPAPPAQACIRCGMCAEACPATLLPQQLYWYSKAKDFTQAENYNLFDCIECGACAYVCPSHIPLVQYYRFAKGEIRQQQRDKAKSDHARQRFEARNARLEREQQEKQAKAEQRKAAAKKRSATAASTPAATTTATTAVSEDSVKKAKVALSLARSKVKKLQRQLDSAQQAGEDSQALEQQISDAQAKQQQAEQALAELEQAPAPTAAPGPSQDPVKKAKVALSLARSKVKKLQRQLDSAQQAGEDSQALEQQISDAQAKQQQAEQALAKLEQAPAPPAAAPGPSQDPVKKAEVALSLARSKVKKLQRQLDSAQQAGQDSQALEQQISDAQAKQQQAEQALAELEKAPAPTAAPGPSQDPVKKAKVALSLARSKVKKLQRQLDSAQQAGQDTQALEQQISDAQAKQQQAEQALAELEQATTAKAEKATPADNPQHHQVDLTHLTAVRDKAQRKAEKCHQAWQAKQDSPHAEALLAAYTKAQAALETAEQNLADAQHLQPPESESAS